MRLTLKSPALARLGWIVLVFAIGMTGVALPAHADEAYGDLDRDGVGDVVSQNGAAAPVKVWLSTAPTARIFLRNHRPIVWVRIIDLDRDGHAELIGADQSSHVHVWQYRAGKLRQVHLPRSRTHVRSGSKGTVDDECESADDDQLPEDGSGPQPCDAPRTPALAAATSAHRVVSDASLTPGEHATSLPPTRAPPVQQ